MNLMDTFAIQRVTAGSASVTTSSRPSIAEVPNHLHSSVVDRLDSAFAEVYAKYQAPLIRADQIPYEVFKRDPDLYSFPTYKVQDPAPAVGSDEFHRLPVSNPVGEITIQVYIPTRKAVTRGGLESSKRGEGAGGLLPALLNFHGGGFVLGGLDTDESLCRKICQGVGCAVVNVGYRTAPEYPHPTPVSDCWDALKWLVRNAGHLGIDAPRIAVGGFSAGGCMAAVLALLARDHREYDEDEDNDDDATGASTTTTAIRIPPLALQLLVVPVIDARHVPIIGPSQTDSTPYCSQAELQFAPCLPLSRLQWFYNLWLGTGEDRPAKAADYLASPIAAESGHSGLAPASIHCAEIDPLLSEGQAYHDKLIAAGTPSRIKVYRGQGHPFTHWDAEVPAAKDFLRDCIASLRDAFGRNNTELAIRIKGSGGA